MENDNVPVTHMIAAIRIITVKSNALLKEAAMTNDPTGNVSIEQIQKFKSIIKEAVEQLFSNEPQHVVVNKLLDGILKRMRGDT